MLGFVQEVLKRSALLVVLLNDEYVCSTYGTVMVKIIFGVVCTIGFDNSIYIGCIYHAVPVYVSTTFRARSRWTWRCVWSTAYGCDIWA